jgi:hypothetical protein
VLPDKELQFIFLLYIPSFINILIAPGFPHKTSQSRLLGFFLYSIFNISIAPGFLDNFFQFIFFVLLLGLLDKFLSISISIFFVNNFFAKSS